ncbi:hypothetical protein [Zooshikella sp. RANM57]|uniref:hypothetical protein n=1 Tax=Zooshikella sp. RANM57 TaxID=3425863 RepID=UPI003D6ED8F6
MQAVSESETPLTLEAVKAKFEAWRQRPKPRKPFPNELWHDFFRLQEQKILTTLRPTCAQFMRKRAVLLGKAEHLTEKTPPNKSSSSSSSQVTEFISVDLATTDVVFSGYIRPLQCKGQGSLSEYSG